MKRLSRPTISKRILLALALGFVFVPLAQTRLLTPAAAAQVTIDSAIIGNQNRYRSSTPKLVFTSDQVGYLFYAINSGACAYVKTTDGGGTWGAAVVFDAQTDCIDASVWYDRWTPGDNTGTNIYIVTYDTGSSDVWYNVLDTSTDTLQDGSSPVDISSSPGPNKTNSFPNVSYRPSLIKATDGKLYVAVTDTPVAGETSWVISCSATCSTASNWSDVGTSPLDNDETDAVLLAPLAGGNVLLTRLDGSASTRESKVWNGSSWDASWTNIMTHSAVDTGAHESLTVDKATGAVYYVAVTDNATKGTNDDIRTAVYSGGTWTNKADVVTDSGVAVGTSCAGVAGTGSGTGCGITSAKVALDENTGDVYVVYSARTTAGTATSGQIYWKKSTDGMTTWSADQGPLNSAALDTTGPQVDIMSNERLYVAWTDTTIDDMLGGTMVDLVPPSYEQADYRLYSNADSTDVGGTLAAQNTPATLPTGGSSFRLRQLVRVSGGPIGAGRANFKLQYAGKGAGTCAAPSGVPNTYTDISATTEIASYDNPTPTGGSALTANANDPTHSPDTVVAQTYNEVGNFTTNTTINVAQAGKFDFTLVDRLAQHNTTYCIRIVQSDGSSLSTYTNYAELTTAEPTTGDKMRAGAWFSGNVEQPFAL